MTIRRITKKYLSILKINTVEEASLEFRLIIIFLSFYLEKYKKTCTYLNCVENLLILSSIITGYVLISAFALLVCVSVGITSSAVGINICAITAEIKKYKSIIKEKKKKHDKIVLLGKHKLNTIEVLISKALIDSYISHDEFASVNNVLREYNEMKKEKKIVKLLCNILYKSNGNLLRQL